MYPIYPWFINLNIIPAAGLGIALYLVGHRFSVKTHNRLVQTALFFLFFLFCLPGLSFILYYLHFFDESLWYVQFRSITGVEILSALWGLFFGFAAVFLNDIIQRKWADKYFFLICLLCILIPFLNPFIRPVGSLAGYNSGWENQLCLESNPGLRGPACLATVSKYYGREPYQLYRNIIKATHPCSTGTEIWYLTRYLKKNGFKAEYLTGRQASEIPPLSIMSDTLYHTGNFVVFTGKDDARYFIADPLKGWVILTPSQFEQFYRQSKFVIAVTP